MPPEHGDQAHLWDMRRYCEEVAGLVEGVTLEQLLGDRVRQLALERAIEVIGEAARRVSAGFKAEHPEIPWQSIVAQRHVLAHDYGEIQHDRLWRVATVHVPELLVQLQSILEEKTP